MLKEIRLKKGLTQEKAAKILGISRRTIMRYEQGITQLSSEKLQLYSKILQNYEVVDEQHGVLSVEEIRRICEEVFKDYAVEYCYLFGSYAKGKERETSDVDLLVNSTEKGIRFYEMTELLRENLKKKVDLLDVSQLNGNVELTREILRDGIKIYG